MDKQKSTIKKVPIRNGQIILILILVMTIALAIGLSIVQKSLVDVSTSSKVEQSSRAFSAAEAGVEKSLQLGSSTSVNFSDNASSATAVYSLLPVVSASGQQDAIEFPPLAKEDVAQVWLVDPNSNSNPPTEFYMPVSRVTNRGIEIYWGSPSAEKAAIEVKIVYYDNSSASVSCPTCPTYRTNSYYFDSDAIRASNNGFLYTGCTSPIIDTTSGIGRSFYCKKVIDASSSPSFPLSGLMLVRMRLLYNSSSQPIAVRGYGTCGSACSLPPQSKTIISTGSAGDTKRSINLFQLIKVVPPLFDYAIFSAGTISK